jgi:hypothetical protein
MWTWTRFVPETSQSTFPTVDWLLLNYIFTPGSRFNSSQLTITRFIAEGEDHRKDTSWSWDRDRDGHALSSPAQCRLLWLDHLPLSEFRRHLVEVQALLGHFPYPCTHCQKTSGPRRMSRGLASGNGLKEASEHNTLLGSVWRSLAWVQPGSGHCLSLQASRKGSVGLGSI